MSLVSTSLGKRWVWPVLRSCPLLYRHVGRGCSAASVLFLRLGYRLPEGYACKRIWCSCLFPGLSDGLNFIFMDVFIAVDDKGVYNNRENGSRVDCTLCLLGRKI